VAAIIAAVVARQSGLAKRNGISLDATVPATSVLLIADPNLIEQALLNLVDNAVRYNRPGGRVEVSLAHTPDGFVLRVTDNGPACRTNSSRRYRPFVAFVATRATSTECVNAALASRSSGRSSNAQAFNWSCATPPAEAWKLR